MNKDVLCLILTISDNSEDHEVEVYKDVLGDMYWHTPFRTQTSSVVSVASIPAERTALHPTIMTVEDALSTLQKRSPTLRDPTLETVMS